MTNTGIPHFIVLCHIVAFFFFKSKARPCTSKKITTHFIAMLTLLHWSGTETAVSEEYLQSANSTLELSQTFQMEVIVHLWVPNLAGPLNHFRVFRTKQNNTHLGPPES